LSTAPGLPFATEVTETAIELKPITLTSAVGTVADTEPVYVVPAELNEGFAATTYDGGVFALNVASAVVCHFEEPSFAPAKTAASIAPCS